MLRAGDRLSWSTQPLLTLEGDARVVDQHIEAPVLLAQEVTQGADALPVVDVQLVEKGAQALGLKLLHSRPTPRLVPRCEHHVSLELPAQGTHDGEADALVGPGDQRYAGGGRHGRWAGPFGLELTRLETDGVAQRGTWRPTTLQKAKNCVLGSSAVIA